jgi:tetratricopeptide (TPR) repeat protein
MTTEKLDVERCLEKTKAQPDSAAAHYNLGLAYTQRGMVDRAEQAYRKALELDPDLVEAWVNLGGVLMLKWDFKGTLEANQEALRRKDDLVLAHYNSGQASLYLGDAEGLVRSSRRVVELDPNHGAGNYFLAVGLLAVGRVDEARIAVERSRFLGHSPAPEFLRELAKAEKGLDEDRNENTETNIGADAPSDEHRR